MKTKDFAAVIRARLAADPNLNAAVEYESEIAQLEQALWDAELRGVKAGLKAAAKIISQECTKHLEHAALCNSVGNEYARAVDSAVALNCQRLGADIRAIDPANVLNQPSVS